MCSHGSYTLHVVSSITCTTATKRLKETNKHALTNDTRLNRPANTKHVQLTHFPTLQLPQRNYHYPPKTSNFFKCIPWVSTQCENRKGTGVFPLIQSTYIYPYFVEYYDSAALAGIKQNNKKNLVFYGVFRQCFIYGVLHTGFCNARFCATRFFRDYGIL